MASGMEEFIESPMMLLQCGVALAVPVVLAAVVNLGCGKKRDQPLRPGGPKKDLSKSKKAGVAGASTKSKRSTKSAASTKSGKKAKKDGSSKIAKSKRSSKSIDKSGKKSKKSSKSSKGSKSSKSKKSKRDIKLQQTGPPSSQRSDALGTAKLQQPPSTRTAIEAEKRSAKLAAAHAGAALANENSVKSAATQQLSLSSKQQPGSGAALVDANANVVAAAPLGTTALVAVGGGTVVVDTMKEDPLIPLELQLMHNFYPNKCIPFGDSTSQPNGCRASMFVPPRSLFDSTRELKMEPAELRWSSAGGMQKISLLNQSNERQAVKVKCSDNNIYRVNPVYAIVEPGQTLNVDVMRQNGSNKVDKIVFVTARAGLEENPKNLFKPGAQSSMMVLPLLAATSAAVSNNQPALAAAC